MLVEPGKAARPVEMKNDLHEMQQMVGGPIQALYPWEEPVAIVCNDEGKNMGLPLNRVLENYDIIAGAFFVCGIQGENFSSLTEKQMQKYQQMFLSPEKFIQTPEGLLCIRINPVVNPKPKSPRIMKDKGECHESILYRRICYGRASG